MDPNAVDHNSHFHIYMRPPTPLQIGPVLLLADNSMAMAIDTAVTASILQTEAQGLLDYAHNTIEGDELMFIMDVPNVPVQETPIVLAQAADSGSTVTQTDYLLQTCQQTTSAGDPASAFRGVDPAGMLKIYIQKRDNRPVRVESITNVTLLEGTMHGKISEWVDSNGNTSYYYDAEPNYVGSDRAVFMAEYEGKVYKIVLELHVFTWVNEKIPSSCPPLNLSRSTANLCPAHPATT